MVDGPLEKMFFAFSALFSFLIIIRFNRNVHFERIRIPGDGHCCFRSILVGAGEDASDMSVREFRRALVRYAHERWDSVSPFLTEDFQTFRSLIGEGDEWGGEVELRLASDMMGRDIRVFNAQSGTWTRYIPEAHAPHSIIFLHFDRNHYSALRIV